MMPFWHKVVDWIIIYQRGDPKHPSVSKAPLCEGCLGHAVIHLCGAMPWLYWKDHLHVSQIGLPGGVTIRKLFPTSGCPPCSTPLLIFV